MTSIQVGWWGAGGGAYTAFSTDQSIRQQTIYKAKQSLAFLFEKLLLVITCFMKIIIIIIIIIIMIIRKTEHGHPNIFS